MDGEADCNRQLKTRKDTRSGSSFKHDAEEGVDGEADCNRQLKTSKDSV